MGTKTNNPKIFHGCLIGWGGRIYDAEQSEVFTPEDRNDADNWDCCAIGEARHLEPAIVGKPHLNRRPDDAILYTLGREFCGAVMDDEPAAARQILNRIEARLVELYGGAA